MLFDRIQLDNVQLPSAIDRIKVDCQFVSIHITAQSWIVEYKLYIAGTAMEFKTGSVILEPQQPGFEGLLTLEGAIKQAAVAMMPVMLGKLS